MKCNNCGEEIANDSNFCEFCGTKIYDTSGVSDNEPVPVLVWFSFFVPIVGFIFYGVYKRKHPSYAKKCFRSGIIGFFLELLLGIIAMVM